MWPSPLHASLLPASSVQMGLPQGQGMGGAEPTALSALTCLNSSQELVQVQKWALYWPRVTAISVLPR